jgi:predicted RNA-binding protein with PUA-like domain
MPFWLMKSEPDEASIDDLAAAPHQTLPWTGVRNYQARNFMRDAMQPGDGVLFYHSPYFDASARPEKPRWLKIDVRLVEKTRLLPLTEMRSAPELAGLRVLQRGNRLSITPVSESDWSAVLSRLRRG